MVGQGFVAVESGPNLDIGTLTKGARLEPVSGRWGMVRQELGHRSL